MLRTIPALLVCTLLFAGCDSAEDDGEPDVALGRAALMIDVAAQERQFDGEVDAFFGAGTQPDGAGQFGILLADVPVDFSEDRLPNGTYVFLDAPSEAVPEPGTYTLVTASTLSPEPGSYRAVAAQFRGGFRVFGVDAINGTLEITSSSGTQLAGSFEFEGLTFDSQSGRSGTGMVTGTFNATNRVDILQIDDEAMMWMSSGAAQ